MKFYQLSLHCRRARGITSRICTDSARKGQ